MKAKQILLVILLSASTTLGTVWGYNKWAKSDTAAVGSSQNGYPANYAGFFDGKIGNAADPIDFTKAANSAVPAVVHIKTRIPAKQQTNNLPRNRGNGMFDDWFNDFFGGNPQSQEQRASGSGVLISGDGYIVTNNHVITNGGAALADEIMVTLHNRKTYKARVIGRDPSSDLAVLKIDGTGFPFLVYGNSDNLQLGQWVLAIGYPLSLETTVTAGIISATGRSIDINRSQIRGNDSPVESFIQTDAAVNSGNSGGALINTSGELIGINSAILAPNGTYAGYSFAIPVKLTKKIVNDIIEFGDVQRGFLGISYNPVESLTDAERKQLGIAEGQEGVYVSFISPDGGAAAAGLQKGDLITAVNGVAVLSGIQMSAQIANFRPGDKVTITYFRKGKTNTASVVLKKRTDVVVNNIGAQLGADLVTLDAQKARQYGIDGGVVVRKMQEGKAMSRTRMHEGFIITSVQGQDVKTLEEFTQALEQLDGEVRLEGIYPGYEGVYPYVLNLAK